MGWTLLLKVTNDSFLHNLEQDGGVLLLWGHFEELLLCVEYMACGSLIFPEKVLSYNAVLQILPQNCFTKLYICTKS
jgi:hypothetical protein